MHGYTHVNTRTHSMCVRVDKFDFHLTCTVHSFHPSAACVREPSSHMWVYVFLGNALRGVGETPVTPLGISYIDDFAKAENSPFYIGETLVSTAPTLSYM